MTTRGFDDRMAKLERKAPPPPDPDLRRKLKILDDWLKLVTGERIAQMTCSELTRLEILSGSDTIMGDDASDLVRGCLDSEQRVIDLEQRRQMLDRWPNR